MARAYPWIVVDLYELNWRDVDRARALVEAGELTGRVNVHHHTAAALTDTHAPTQGTASAVA